MNFKRADELVANALNISRNKASELIKNEQIKANEKIITKASQLLDINTKFTLLNEIFVSRAAIKLENFLNHIQLNIKNKQALDIGSSTGGFAQILLKKGVKHITCVDVGTNQLNELLKNNNCVTSYENTDIRDFAKTSKEKFDLVTIDVSFISLRLILPSVKILAKDDIIMLFKPQFEVGKDVKRNKKGVVQNQKIIQNISQDFENFCLNFNLKLIAKQDSFIKGKNGNQEIFYYFKI